MLLPDCFKFQSFIFVCLIIYYIGFVLKTNEYKTMTFTGGKRLNA